MAHLGQHPGLVGAAGQQQRDHRTAHPRHPRLGGQAGPQLGSEALQQLVAGADAVAGIELAQIADAQGQQGEGGTGRALLAQGIELLDEAQAVGQAGQGVVPGRPGLAAHRLGQIGLHLAQRGQVGKTVGTQAGAQAACRTQFHLGGLRADRQAPAQAGLGSPGTGRFTGWSAEQLGQGAPAQLLLVGQTAQGQEGRVGTQHLVPGVADQGRCAGRLEDLFAELARVAQLLLGLAHAVDHAEHCQGQADVEEQEKGRMHIEQGMRQAHLRLRQLRRLVAADGHQEEHHIEQHQPQRHPPVHQQAGHQRRHIGQHIAQARDLGLGAGRDRDAHAGGVDRGQQQQGADGAVAPRLRDRRAEHEQHHRHDAHGPGLAHQPGHHGAVQAHHAAQQDAGQQHHPKGAKLDIGGTGRSRGRLGQHPMYSALI
eukprot:Opistho-2@25012